MRALSARESEGCVKITVRVRDDIRERAPWLPQAFADAWHRQTRNPSIELTFGATDGGRSTTEDACVPSDDVAREVQQTTSRVVL